MNTKPAIIVFTVIAVVWWLFDRVVKIFVDSFNVNDVIVENVIGLFNFTLIHNTGAAWGMFSDSTVPLGVFSCIVCALIVVYLFALRKGRAHVLEVIGLALVFSGGLGNAFDRLTIGYVVDFINTTFISFPVFNIADIGVTCGIVLFLLGYFISSSHMEDERH